MGKIMDNKFRRRYGGKIVIVYSGKRESPAKEKEHKAQLAKAYENVLFGILGRAAKPEELMGIKKLS